MIVLVYEAFQAVPLQQLNPSEFLVGWTVMKFRKLKHFCFKEKKCRFMSIGKNVEYDGF